MIGLGVGAAHALGYREAGVTVAALCDLDEGALKAHGQLYPEARLTIRPEDVLDDPAIDIVSVASWDDAHHPQVLAALRNDKHVFVEKPLCQTEAQAREIAAELSQRPELVLSSNLPLRWSPRFVRLRQLVADGALGTLYYAELDYEYGRLWKLTEGWRGRLERYSVVLGGAVHMVDLLLWLTGQRVVDVQAASSGLATHATAFRPDDLVVALLRLEGGLVAKLAANFACVAPHFHGVRVFGTEATFINGLEQATLLTGRDDEPSREAIDEPYPAVAKGVGIPAFVEAIRTGTPPPITVSDVFHALSVCFAIERAAGSGERCRPRPLGYPGALS